AIGLVSQPGGPRGIRDGRGSGIGASIVEHLCEQRARVAFVDILREASHALIERIRARAACTNQSYVVDGGWV
ncbi:MAG TPA: hypothetical protein VF653_14280, partial [Methylomirabilota bacterium]